MNTVFGSYLFLNLNYGREVNPDPEICDTLARAIVSQFTMTKTAVGNGWESWFDIETGKGRLVNYASRHWFPYYLLHRAEEKKDRALNGKNWSCNLYNFFRRTQI
ncbi:uncharacterized protein LOC124311530 [Daphnia pulicaria]|uniref:uncharacterized protein LOC124311530 n=1 Tax=Daphnia pulicaria TaxID=35523 RepID=UPI001EEB139B|nr:uncharacterized protein LOC124311530 [Daphnia pulicaria]